MAKPRQTRVIAVTLIQGQRPHRRCHVAGERPALFLCGRRDLPGWWPDYSDYSVSQQRGSNSLETGAVSTNHSTKFLIHLLTKAVIDACYIQESLKMTFLF